jgi:hypothetical protein
MTSKTAKKMMGGLVVFCLILGAGIYYVSHADDDRRPDPILVTHLAGIGLGMSPTDITLTLGKPSLAAATEVDERGRAHLTYTYTKERNQDYSLDITFFGPDRLSMRAVVICERGGFSSLLGLDRYSSEEAVLGVLGPPSHSSIRNDGLEKVMSYNDWNASFKIARGKVAGLCIHQGKFIEYDKQAPQHARPGRADAAPNYRTPA